MGVYNMKLKVLLLITSTFMASVRSAEKDARPKDDLEIVNAFDRVCRSTMAMPVDEPTKKAFIRGMLISAVGKTDDVNTANRLTLAAVHTRDRIDGFDPLARRKLF